MLHTWYTERNKGLQPEIHSILAGQGDMSFSDLVRKLGKSFENTNQRPAEPVEEEEMGWTNLKQSNQNKQARFQGNPVPRRPQRNFTLDKYKGATCLRCYNKCVLKNKSLHSLFIVVNSCSKFWRISYINYFFGVSVYVEIGA